MTLIRLHTTTNELNVRVSEIPADLMAVNSELSPRFPKVISEESNMAKGKACGTITRAIHQKNCASTSIVRPLPTSSSTERHKNYIISTKRQMKNVPRNNIPNCLQINMSSFFILNMSLLLSLPPVAFGLPSAA